MVFTNLLPSDFEKRAVVLDIKDSCDFFGDGSVILQDVSGHTQGQTGIFLPEYNTFFAADSLWGSEFLNKNMRAAGRFIQKDYSAYCATLEKIQHMQKNGIQIVFSHEVAK